MTNDFYDKMAPFYHLVIRIGSEVLLAASMQAEQ